MKYYTIGEVAELFGIPASTLRFYEKTGLLIPQHRNKETGYRYYTQEQFLRLDVILFLKSIGCSNSSIVRELAQARSRNDLIDLIRARRKSVQDELSRLSMLEQRLGSLEHTYEMFHDCHGFLIQDFPERHIYCVDASDTPSAPLERMPRELRSGKEELHPLIETLDSDIINFGYTASLKDFSHTGTLSYRYHFCDIGEKTTPVPGFALECFPSGTYLVFRFSAERCPKELACQYLLDYLDKNHLVHSDCLIESGIGFALPPLDICDYRIEYQVYLPES